MNSPLPPSPLPDSAPSIAVVDAPVHGASEMRPYLWMLCGAGAFATMSAFAHALGKRMEWQYVAASRAAIPMFIALALAVSYRVKLVFWRPWTLWWRSIAGSASLMLAFFALTRPAFPIANVVTVTNLFPIWIAILSWPLVGAVPPLRVWLAIAIGITGVYLIQNPDLSVGDYGFIAALASSVFSALALLGLNRLQGIDSRAIVFHFSFVALLFTSLAILIRAVSSDAAPIEWDGRCVLFLLGLGVSATIGQMLLTKAFTLGDPAKVSVIGLSQVGFALAYDVGLWNREFNARSLLGIALVVVPTAWMLLASRHSPPKAAA